ncbi:uncharacterized protein MELLADRAFT_107978 [Melampsora larici-populina 98AG31]|uniref:Uncharacterized protein n=1 Tax=Melampsora larici-populina (strain 98AG31 / pathotype 3-4-7) TaxID=747676 RepID=F4RRK4_MELLP|nr:uncharacterized protein MELLADRAFT_107978 [Melampsora larici-populina 98AG31]EGG05011.1 hypothetical protein MELLADRAFT_107978 [Melampsora larici-populina 98AG31]
MSTGGRPPRAPQFHWADESNAESEEESEEEVASNDDNSGDLDDNNDNSNGGDAESISSSKEVENCEDILTKSENDPHVSTTVSGSENPEADTGAFKPLPQNLVDLFQLTEAQPELVEFKSNLKLDHNLLETIVRSVLLTKCALDSRHKHQESVSARNSFESGTARLHSDYAPLYESHKAQAMEDVEKVQLELNCSLNLIDEPEVKSQIQEFTIKHYQMLMSSDTISWDPMPIQRSETSNL